MTEYIARLFPVQRIRVERAWLVIIAILLVLGFLDQAQVLPTLRFVLEALLSTAPYIAFAVLCIGYLKATGAETLIARAFEGRETRMIVLAALIGGLAPFCSCEVIPFVAGLLALGAPLSAIMAFWLSSPLIDPASLLITASALGWPFAIAKTVLAVAIGLSGGFAMKAMVGTGLFANPLKPQKASCCGCGTSPTTGKPHWRFWEESERRETFWTQTQTNALFLLKWLTLAYVLESLMVTYVPAGAIASVVGGDGVFPIIISALVGAPAYLNSYAAPALVSGLMEQGMSAGAGMAFMIAGAISCIPAMTAVFALVHRSVFAAYVGLGFVGAVVSGIVFGMVASG